jgi:peptidoglycan hydrolase-like protein with peptidoglycan-binding domain/beta-N-acetylglucosaminidase
LKKQVFIALCTAAGMLGPVGSTMLPPASAYAATAHLLRYGSRGADVADLQRKLNTLGYSCGPVDGVFGSRTRSAVMAFQRAHHLQVDGIVGAATLSELAKALAHSNSSKSGSNSSSRGDARTTTPSSAPKYPGKPLAIGSRGSNVTLIQQQLNKLGYNCGTPDGVYGSRTAAAVRAFQRAHHVKEDGIVNAQTWSLLFSQPSRNPSQGGSTTTTTYTAYDVYNHKIAGPFTKQTDAINALKKANNGSPGGYVKDSAGHVVYRQPYFAAYDRNNHLLGTYLTESAAKAKVTGVPGGYVKTLDGKRLDVQPDYAVFIGNPSTPAKEFVKQSDAEAYLAQNGTDTSFVVDVNHGSITDMPKDYFYMSNGHWSHHTAHLGTDQQDLSIPSHVVSGAIYIALDNKVPPYFVHFYQISLNGKYAVKDIGSYENPFRTVDLNYKSPNKVSAATIDSWLRKKNSPIQGLGWAFVEAQEYGVNSTYLAAHAFQETGSAASSAWKSGGIALTKNNLFGYAAYDNGTWHAAVFPSEDYAIRFEAWIVSQDYLQNFSQFAYLLPSGHALSTVDGVNRYYASDHNWSLAIGDFMNEIANSAGASVNDYVLFDSTNKPARSEAITDEPTYAMSGATGKITKNATVYSDYAVHRPTLRIGAEGDWVKTLQRALNKQGESVAVDGIFGSGTLGAVTDFQSRNGLDADGICGPMTWAKVLGITTTTVSANTPVRIDGIREGFDVDFIPFYHITYTDGNGTTQSGWVSGKCLTLDNVYRLNTPAGVYTVDVKDGSGKTYTLHMGDYVVAASPTSQTITFVPQQNPETPITGTILTSGVTLTQVKSY